MLDDLHGVIEKLQTEIKTHHDYLSRIQPEMRTRQVLIDPLLRELGWTYLIQMRSNLNMESRISGRTMG